MPHAIRDTVTLVTGAGSGIGRGLAALLADRGAPLVLADIRSEPLEALAGEIRAKGGRCITATLDIVDPDAWQALVARAEAELGPVRLLCNVAGVTLAPGPIIDMSPDQVAWVVQTNLLGTCYGAMAVASRLKALGLGGQILNTASVQALFASPGFAAYNMSKFGILGLSETLRIELAEHGISVSVVCPGPTRGNILANSAAIAPDLVPPPTGRARGGFIDFRAPEALAVQIVEGLERGDLFIITHPEYRSVVEARWAALSGAFGGTADPAAAATIEAMEAAALAIYRA